MRLEYRINKFKYELSKKLFKNRYINGYEIIIPRIHEKGLDGNYDDCTVIYGGHDRIKVLNKCEEVDCYYTIAKVTIDKKKDDIKMYDCFMNLEDTINALNKTKKEM